MRTGVTIAISLILLLAFVIWLGQRLFGGPCDIEFDRPNWVLTCEGSKERVDLGIACNSLVDRDDIAIVSIHERNDGYEFSVWNIEEGIPCAHGVIER